MSEIENNYPESFFRGVTESNMIDLEYKSVLGEIFRFDDRYKNEEGYAEASINWNDDEGALENLKTQIKEGTEVLKYANGIIKIPTRKVKEMKKRYKEQFSYERRPVEGNDYHGNILLNIDKFNKLWRKKICSELATAVEIIYTYNKEKCSWVETKTEIE